MYGYGWHILPLFEDLSQRRHQPFPSPYPLEDSIGLRSSGQHIPSYPIHHWNGLLTYKVCITNSIRWIGYSQIFTQPCYDWPETFYSIIFWGNGWGTPSCPPGGGTPPPTVKNCHLGFEGLSLGTHSGVVLYNFYAGGDREQQEFCQYWTIVLTTYKNMYFKVHFNLR